jgi:hypothetical protein
MGRGSRPCFNQEKIAGNMTLKRHKEEGKRAKEEKQLSHDGGNNFLKNYCTVK